MKISISRINTFHTCAKKYELSYIQRLTRWNNEVNARSWGSLFHSAMGSALRTWHFTRDKMDVSEAIYEVVDSYREQNPDPELQEAVDQMCYEIGRVAWRTFEHMRFGEQYELVTYKEISKDDEMFQDEFESLSDYQEAIDAGYFVMDDYPLVEYRFSEKHPSGHTLTGYIDCVVKNLETDHYEVLDFKSKDKFNKDIADEYEGEQLKAQLPLYVHMIRQRGLDVRMFTIYQVLQKVPQVPTPIKSGKRLHKWTSLTTDLAAYREGIRRHGFNEEDYADAIEALSAMKDYFFRPLRIVVSDDRAERFAEELVRTADMIEGLDYYAPNLNWKCPGCPFVPICMSEMDGNSYDDLIGTLYNVKNNEQ